MKIQSIENMNGANNEQQLINVEDILVANGWKIEPFGVYSYMVGKGAYRVILPVWMLEASMDTNLSYEDYNLPEVIAPQRRSGMSFSGIKWLWNKVKGNK